MQAANEKVVQANEKLQTLNEEIQNANEELRTAQEEILTANEETTTVNNELAARNAQLTQLNDDFTNLTKSIQLPVVIVGNDLRIRFFTQTSNKVFSIVASDVGRSINDIKPKVKVSNLEGLISQVINDFKIIEREVQDEQGHWHNLQIRPYQTSDNRMDGAVMTFGDISEEYRHFLEAMVQTVTLSLVVLDSQLRVKMVNQSFCDTFHVKAEQAENKFIYELGNKQWDIPALRKLLEDVLPSKCKFSNYEVDHQFESIGRKVMLVSASQIDVRQSILLSIEDITDRKRHADALVRANQELNQFAYVVAHDLQEPVRLMSSYVDLLKMHSEKKLDEDAQSFLGFIKQGSLQALVLIQDLLSYGTVSGGGRALELIDFETILKEVLAEIRILIEESSAEITQEALPALMADRIQIIRLFQNLMTNAIKYRAKRPLKIHISARKEKNRWLFSVRDNGIGIDPEHNEWIFEIFKRLHSKTEYPGTGIGLAICKKIVQWHSGEIWTESKPGKGSTFFFSLPREA